MWNAVQHPDCDHANFAISESDIGFNHRGIEFEFRHALKRQSTPLNILLIFGRIEFDVHGCKCMHKTS